MFFTAYIRPLNVYHGWGKGFLLRRNEINRLHLNFLLLSLYPPPPSFFLFFFRKQNLYSRMNLLRFASSFDRCHIYNRFSLRHRRIKIDRLLFLSGRKIPLHMNRKLLLFRKESITFSPGATQHLAAQRVQFMDDYLLSGMLAGRATDRLNIKYRSRGLL